MSGAPWLAAGGCLTAAFLWMRALGDLGARVGGLWCALALAAVGYGLAAWMLLRREPAPVAPWSLPLVGGFALLFRLTLVGAAPSLSDDVYRYLWDGRVQAAGINPYAFPPDADELTPLRDADWARVNHREVATVYPPLAQGLFGAVHAVAPGLFGLKAALVGCDLALIAALWRLLAARGLDPRRVALYAWHPLPVVEIAGSGHVDVLGVLLLVLALLFLVRERRHASALALAAAALAKVVPLVCVPAFWGCWARPGARGWRRWLDPRPRAPLAWLPVAAAAAYVPFAGAGPGLWSGLRTFAEKWRFNDSLYGLVYALLADPAPGWAWDDRALLAARWLCLGLLALAAVVVATRCADPVRACLWLFGVQLLLAPTVHPWYALWLVPGLALSFEAPWVALSWLVFLAYEVLAGYRATGLWEEAAWVRWAEYGPVYALLAWSAVRRLRRRQPGNESSRPTSAGAA